MRTLNTVERTRTREIADKDDGERNSRESHLDDDDDDILILLVMLDVCLDFLSQKGNWDLRQWIKKKLCPM